jgi:hypothetical protein
MDAGQRDYKHFPHNARRANRTAINHFCFDYYGITFLKIKQGPVLKNIAVFLSELDYF